MKNHSLAFNSFFNVIYRTLNLLFPLAVYAYVARIINSDLIGEVGFAQNITQYFVLLSTLGIPSYGTREIARTRDNNALRDKVFTELFCLNAISTSVCLIIYTILIFTISALKSHFILFLITGINLFLNYINVDWVYHGHEQYRYIAIKSFIVKIISLASIFIFVSNSNDYLKYALISAVALAGNNIYNVAHLKKLGIRIEKIDLDIKKHLGPVFNLLCTTIAIELYTLLDTTMIGIECSKDNVAFYNYAMRITKAIIAIVAAIGGVLLPRLSYYKGQNNLDGCTLIVEKTLNIMIYFFIPSAVGISICAREIILFLYGEGFLNSIPILIVSSLLVVTLGFNNLFGTQILITFGKENKLMFATIVGAASNIIFNYFLISRYQGVGAVIASVFSETLVTSLTLYYAKNVMKIRINKRNLFISIISCVIMGGVLFVLKIIMHQGALLLFVEVTLGIIIYVTFTIQLKNTVAVEIMNRISSILRSNLAFR